MQNYQFVHERNVDYQIVNYKDFSEIIMLNRFKSMCALTLRFTSNVRLRSKET